MKLHFFGRIFGFGYFAISKDEIDIQLINAETDDSKSFKRLKNKLKPKWGKNAGTNLSSETFLTIIFMALLSQFLL